MNGRRRFFTALLGAWVALLAAAGAILAVAHSASGTDVAQPAATPNRVVSTKWKTVTITKTAGELSSVGCPTDPSLGSTAESVDLYPPPSPATDKTSLGEEDACNPPPDDTAGPNHP
ncbi:MAG TPA: hypothetical protein PKH97_05265 [Tetrasphaera sp.]|uniref:hypothetical protein n=1 Tax=Nostocoides sp. TaxID=1917966 RepID=UPI002D1249E1|nr:hypothetical protein [Tetrasphaera sp.]HNQ06579.1 hypothetical protein [Tetrasphaera sp.]